MGVRGEEECMWEERRGGEERRGRVGERRGRVYVGGEERRGGEERKSG